MWLYAFYKIIIILMQALIATSRSVSQDIFWEKESERKYKQHVKKVSSINKIKQYPTVQQAKEVDKMSKTIYKYKESAKSFKQREQNAQRKRENRILLQKIWKTNSTLKTDNGVMHLQHQSGSNWSLKKRQFSTINEQNKKIGINIISQRSDKKEYKKKLEEEIKQYLELRKNIRKCTYDQDKKVQIKRAKSERKLIVLKLKDDDHEQNNAQVSDQKDKINKNALIKNQLNSNKQSKVKREVSSQKLSKRNNKKQVSGKNNQPQQKSDKKKQQLNTKQ